MTSTTDRIEKQVLLRAPQERVWRAISEAEEFGNWFGMEFDDEFAPGTEVRGRCVMTKVDPDVARAQEPFVGQSQTFCIDRIEPIHTFSYRWHPFAISPEVDYSSEPLTLVTFTLASAEGGTLLTIVETGLGAIPIARRTDAFGAEDACWDATRELVGKHIALRP
jgi:uncharacterized protein YndB with AHSA1/START domain